MTGGRPEATSQPHQYQQYSVFQYPVTLLPYSTYETEVKQEVFHKAVEMKMDIKEHWGRTNLNT
jgi:hypothetical protein